MTGGLYSPKKMAGGVRKITREIYRVLSPTRTGCGQLSSTDDEEEEEEDGRVCLCLAGCGGRPPGVSYAVYSISINSLLNPSRRGGAIPSITAIDGNCLGMGCGILGSKIYFVGGQQLNKNNIGEDATSLALPPYSLYDYSNNVIVHEIESSGRSQPPGSSSMKSGKASPLVISMEKNLYVLAGTPVYILLNPTFEKCDGNEWSGLHSPPFLDPNSNHFEDPGYRGYVVIGDWIHVSTSSSSFSFNTKDPKAEWQACTLFGDAYPFDFDGRAVLYKEGNDDDNNNCILICIVLSQGIVVAHKLVNGKVDPEQTQLLEGLTIPTDAISACLAELGQGLFCLVLSCFDYNRTHKNSKSTISMKSFKVSKEDKKLKCDVLKEFKPSIEQSSPNQIWSATSCFVPNNSTDKKLMVSKRVEENREVGPSYKRDEWKAAKKSDKALLGLVKKVMIPLEVYTN